MMPVGFVQKLVDDKLCTKRSGLMEVAGCPISLGGGEWW